jgi:hypothetical protein
MCKAIARSAGRVAIAAGFSRKRNRPRVSRLMAAVSVAAAALVVAPAAAASQPITSYSIHHVAAVLTDVCAFPVTVEGDSPYTERDFFDESGALIRIEIHATEQDTFNANGKSLTGEPYTFDIRILFDSSGAITHAFFAGVVEKVVLPDGSLFLAAGLVDFAAHGFPEALIAPDEAPRETSRASARRFRHEPRGCRCSQAASPSAASSSFWRS